MIEYVPSSFIDILFKRSLHHARYGLTTTRARVGTNVIKYATKNTTKMKTNFSYCDQIKFNEPVLKPGIPE